MMHSYHAQGFKYKMRYVYAHFPITGVINKGGHQLEIRNFLGEKRRRTVNLAGDVTVEKSEDVKDQIEVSGINVEDVGRSCAYPQNRTKRSFSRITK